MNMRVFERRRAGGTVSLREESVEKLCGKTQVPERRPAGSC